MKKRPRAVTKDRPEKQEPEITAELDSVTANLVFRPTVNAALTSQAHLPWGPKLGLSSLVTELDAQVKAISHDNMARPEAMLIAHAHSLDAIFNELARLSRKSTLMPHMETYLRLALRAQSQCRTTIETLALIKNPPNVAFVRQANIAHGLQQVNNATESSRARKTETAQNKLLEQTHGDRLDFGAPGPAGRADSTVASLDEVHGPEDSGGQGSGGQKRL